MKAEYSGNIYKFKLEFDKGYAYAEMLDFSDVSDFDGRLVQVFNVIDIDGSMEHSIEEIISSGILLGPLCVNKYPAKTGKNAWKLCGKNKKYNKTTPIFKYLKAVRDNYNWSELKPWYKNKVLSSGVNYVECDYEEVRGLETSILNHIDTIKDKVAMMLIIAEGKKVSKYYDVNYIGFKNLYAQLVNTYYPKATAEKLLKDIPATL